MDLLRFYYTQNPTPMEDEDLFDAYVKNNVCVAKARIKVPISTIWLKTAEHDYQVTLCRHFLFQFSRTFLSPPLTPPVIVTKKLLNIPTHIFQLIKLRFLITDLTLHLLSLSSQFLLFCPKFFYQRKLSTAEMFLQWLLRSGIKNELCFMFMTVFVSTKNLRNALDNRLCFPVNINVIDLFFKNLYPLFYLLYPRLLTGWLFWKVSYFFIKICLIE